MTKIYLHIAVFLATSLCLGACRKNEYLLYDGSQKDSVFFSYKNDKNENDSILSYSFNYNIATEHIIEIPVTLMGVPKSTPRTIDVRAVDDATDMVVGTHYVIESAELPAEAVTSTIKIKLLRDKDPKLQEKVFTLRLELRENGDLRPTGSKVFIIKYSDIRPTVRPEWWATWAPLPEYSFEAAQVFFDYFYRLVPKTNKDIYEEMILAYGHYFANAKKLRGPLALYDTFLIRYVLMPMHKETKDRFKWQKEPSL